jgi:excisionase family DNA binding protein
MTEFLSTSQVAKLLGISRIAVFKKIKSGEIKAKKVGRNYIVKRSDLGDVFRVGITQKRKKELEQAVKKVVAEYGEALKMLEDN